MALDRRVVCERLSSGRACGKRHKFRREERIGAKRRCHIGRQRRNPFAETDCHAHGVLFVRARFTLFRSQMAHRDHAARWSACITHLRIHLYTGHIFVIDLQHAVRFFQTITRKRERERAEQDQTA